MAGVMLIAAIALYRICMGLSAGHPGWMENFAPVAAVALCGGVYLPRRMAYGVPLVAMLISDVALNAHYHVALVSAEMVSRYGALAVIVWLGCLIRNHARLAAVLPASVLGSVIFYLVTNTSAWLTGAEYAKTAGGWVQALTTGVPGYEPTWMFFRSSLISDLLFSALFVFCMAVTRGEAREAAPMGEVARVGR
jgi:hypothetical protein